MGGRFAELDSAETVAAIGPAGAMQTVDFGNYGAGIHARLDPVENRLVNRQRQLHRRDHQVDFGL